MSKTAVYLINGFLGSGKTSTLLKCKEYFKKNNKKIAIILNELGNANVEKHLFADESLFELLNGCVCCSIKEDLKTTLTELMTIVKQEKIDVILLEGTGVANPGEIIETFAEKQFAEHFTIEQSICVIDSVHVTDYISVFSSSKEVRQLQKEQMERGSLLVLNKMDQLPKKEKIEKINKLVRKYNQTAPIVYSTYGEGVTNYLENHTFVLPENTGDIHSNHLHLKAIKIEQRKELSKRDIKELLLKHKDKLIRAKGTVQNCDDMEWYHFQFASGQLIWEQLKDHPSYARGQIILIGEGLKEQDVHL
ncbi:CobW family GTP-binding protein [Niallia sp. 03091]|uniref:CobW family GTP-binding protein n=1 Tax=unclassified Niallia TaxID=2837522 RepID=UPI00404451A6